MADFWTYISVEGTKEEVDAILEVIRYYKEDAYNETYWYLEDNGTIEPIKETNNGKFSTNIQIGGPYGSFTLLEEIPLFEELADAAPNAEFSGVMEGFNYSESEVRAELKNGKLELKTWENSFEYNEGYDTFAMCQKISEVLPEDEFAQLFKINDINAIDYDDLMLNTSFPDLSYEDFLDCFEDCSQITEEEYESGLQELKNKVFPDISEFKIYENRTYNPETGEYTEHKHPEKKANDEKVNQTQYTTKLSDFKTIKIDNKTLEIYQYIGHDVNVEIPSEIKGKSVLYIDDSAFSNCDSLQSIIIPDSVTHIGYRAFEDCTSLKSVTISKGVKEIKAHAFSGCSSLKSINVSENNPYYSDIEGVLFDKSAKTLICYPNRKEGSSYKIPDGVTNIGHSAFEKIISLERVTTSEEEKEINDKSNNATPLQNIIIPDSVTEIENKAFSKCSSLQSITIPSSITSVGESAFEYCTSLERVTIYEGLVSVGTCAFWNCTSLQNIIIPKNVTDIGYMSFAHCTNLTDIAITENVTQIGNDAFIDCPSLKSIKVSENNSHYSDIDGVLFDKSAKKLICYPPQKVDSSYEIPDGVTNIAGSSFCVCNYLQNIILPNSVTSIGARAFDRCTSLQNITISDNVTDIGGCAFANCTSLKSVNIPVNLTKIEDLTFMDCASLENVTIAENVTNIGDRTFMGCKSLKSITIPDNVTHIHKRAFMGCTSLKNINAGENNPNYYSKNGVLYDKSGKRFSIKEKWIP